MEERLRKFAQLVDAGSFTQASKELHISQPALSSAINKLERELSCQLLVRQPRSLKLTKAGKLAYGAGKQLIIQKGNLATKIGELSQEPTPLTIGMIDSVADALFAAENYDHILERQAKTSIVVNDSTYLLDAVKRDKLDIAFIVEQPRPLPSLIEATFVVPEPLVLVCHNAQVSVVQQSLHRGQLPNFISYNQHSTSYQLIDRALQHEGIEASPTFLSTSPAVMLKLVLLQKGPAVLPHIVVKDYLRKGTLSILTNPKPVTIERNIIRITRQEKHMTSEIDHITKHAQVVLQSAGTLLRK